MHKICCFKRLLEKGYVKIYKKISFHFLSYLLKNHLRGENTIECRTEKPRGRSHNHQRDCVSEVEEQFVI